MPLCRRARVEISSEKIFSIALTPRGALHIKVFTGVDLPLLNLFSEVVRENYAGEYRIQAR